MNDESGVGRNESKAAHSFDAVLEVRVGALGRGQVLLLALASISQIAMAALLMLMVFTAQDPINMPGAWRCVLESPALAACTHLLAVVSKTSASSPARALAEIISNATDENTAASETIGGLEQRAVHAAFCALPPGATAWTAPASSLLSFYGLTCGREWHASLLDSLYFVGLAVGGMAFGAVSDRWGRRACLYSCAALAAGASVAEALMPAAAGLAGFWTHGAFRLVSATAVQGLALADVVLVTELVGPDYRGRVGILTQSFFIAGECLLALLAAYISDWRLLTLLCAALPAAFIATCLVVPESPRWLAAEGRRHDAAVTLAVLAAWNGRGKQRESGVEAIEAALEALVADSPRHQHVGRDAIMEGGGGNKTRLPEPEPACWDTELVARGACHWDTPLSANSTTAAAAGGDMCQQQQQQQQQQPQQLGGSADVAGPATTGAAAAMPCCADESETAALLMHVEEPPWSAATGGRCDTTAVAAHDSAAPRRGGSGINDSAGSLVTCRPDTPATAAVGVSGGCTSTTDAAYDAKELNSASSSSGGGVRATSANGGGEGIGGNAAEGEAAAAAAATSSVSQCRPRGLHGPPPTLLQAARHPLVMFYFALLSFALCALVLSYYGIGFALSYIPGSIYVSFFLISIAELPSALLMGLLIDRLGRCALVLGGMAVSGVGCIGCGLASGSQVAQVLLAMLGKFGASGAWDVLVVYCAEVFPTSVRSVASGAIYQGARVGGVAAPFVFLLGSATGAPQAPFWLMGGVTLAAACLCLWLPETSGCDQPESLQEMQANAGRTTLVLFKNWWEKVLRKRRERRNGRAAEEQGPTEVRVGVLEVVFVEGSKAGAAALETYAEQRPLLQA